MLLNSALTVPVGAQVRDQIAAETHGNLLALVETPETSNLVSRTYTAHTSEAPSDHGRGLVVDVPVARAQVRGGVERAIASSQ